MTIAREGTGFRADCALNLGTGVHVHAEASAHDAYDCVIPPLSGLAAS